MNFAGTFLWGTSFLLVRLESCSQDLRDRSVTFFPILAYYFVVWLEHLYWIHKLLNVGCDIFLSENWETINFYELQEYEPKRPDDHWVCCRNISWVSWECSRWGFVKVSDSSYNWSRIEEYCLGFRRLCWIVFWEDRKFAVKSHLWIVPWQRWKFSSVW